MRTCFCWAVAAWAVVCVGGVRAGTVQYVSQARSVLAEVGSVEPSQSDQHSAPDFGPFVSIAHTSFLDVFDEEGATANAEQKSFLLGSAIGVFDKISIGGSDAFAGGHSHFHVVFDVAQAQPYALTYARQFDASGDGNQGGTVKFTRTAPANGTLLDFPFDFTKPGSPTQTFHQSGVLVPGRYELQVDLDGGAGQSGNASGVLTANLVIGAPLPVGAWAALPLLAVGFWLTRRSCRCP